MTQKLHVLGRRRPSRLDSREQFRAIVEHVYDGDTIQVRRVFLATGEPWSEIIRLAGVDAPELKSADPRPALAALNALTALIADRDVLVRPTHIWRDLHHRIVARVLVDEIDVGTWMVQNGFADRISRPMRMKNIMRESSMLVI